MIGIRAANERVVNVYAAMLYEQCSKAPAQRTAVCAINLPAVVLDEVVLDLGANLGHACETKVSMMASDLLGMVKMVHLRL